MQGPHHDRQGWQRTYAGVQAAADARLRPRCFGSANPRRFAAAITRLDSGDSDVAEAIVRRCACLGSKQSSGATEPLDETG